MPHKNVYGALSETKIKAVFAKIQLSLCLVFSPVMKVHICVLNPEDDEDARVSLTKTFLKV